MHDKILAMARFIFLLFLYTLTIVVKAQKN